MAANWVCLPVGLGLAGVSTSAALSAEAVAAGALGHGVTVDIIVFGAVVLGLAFLVVSLPLRRDTNHANSHSVQEAVDHRTWPALITRRDGKVLAVNSVMAEMAPSGQTVLDRIAPVLGVTAPEIYRMSRLGLQDGLALELFRVIESGDPVALSVQHSAPDHLVWQILSRSRLSTLFPDGGALRYDTAPFGYVRFSAMDGPVVNDLFTDIFSDEALEILREQVDSGVFTSGRITLPARDGRERLALSALRVERGAANESHEIFLFVPDAETINQVNASETLEAIPVSLLHLDIEGRVFWGNTQARKMLGDRFEVGRNLGDIVQLLSRSMSSLLSEVQTGHGGSGDEMVRLDEEDVEAFAQVSLTRLTVQGQPSILAVLTDASELRMVEEKFAQSQKMEAVGKLAGGVAHDFNNLLTAITGNCDLLLLRKDASHPDYPDLTQIRQNANRAAALVRQLLAFSRKQTLQPKLLSVQDVVTDTLYLLDRLIGETITLSLDHGRELGSVRADNQQLEQALMNLVVNARDAMPKGGLVTISTRNHRVIEERHELGVSIPVGEYVEISVSDNGSGVDPQVIDRVFDPFFTTKGQGEGTGLGLSTVYGIVKQSGGYIYVTNRTEGGARFTILLPRAYPESSDVEVAPAPVIDPETADLTGHGSVLLVEDEAPVRSVASRALKMRGYRVIEASCAEDAIEVLEGGTEEINVIVSDVVMPGMDGPTFAGKARKLRPDLRVVFISGYAEDSFRRNLKDKDFLFLAKPFSLNELTSTVKMALDGNDAPPT